MFSHNLEFKTNVLWSRISFISVLAGNWRFIFDAGLPNTSILDTSTEDLDTSQSEDSKEPPAKQAKTSDEKMDVSIQIWRITSFSGFCNDQIYHGCFPFATKDVFISTILLTYF